MSSPCGRWTVSYNGELYNHRALRAELRGHGHNFRGTSDTEVLLLGLVQWGLVATLNRANGMFALAAWDERDRTLHLARDRLGIKPLYYGWSGDSFLFASQLHALARHPSFALAVDPDALAGYLRYQYVPGPYCIAEGIRKLPPGMYLSLRDPAARGTAPAPYWRLPNPSVDPSIRERSEIVGELRELLTDAVRLRMEADVPLGAFLSGGIDSSTVVALMQENSAVPVNTFTIGFPEQQFDEAGYAREISAYLGTNHTELCVSGREMLDVVPSLSDMFDEPFGDSSQIPMAVVARLARTRVTVALSGDGGDELFAGYRRYAWGERAWQSLERAPRPVRRAMAALAFQGARVTRHGGFAAARLTRRLRAAAQLASAADAWEAYRWLISHCREPAMVMGQDFAGYDIERRSLTPYIPQAATADLASYLPDDILTKVDRATMFVGLEARVPLLDHRVVEFAQRLPLDAKVVGGVTKWPLRQVLFERVPHRLLDRPKKGFSVPIGQWLRGPLVPWAEELLSQERLAREQYLDAKVVRRMWEEHRRGVCDWHSQLWDILAFQNWHAAARQW